MRRWRLGTAAIAALGMIVAAALPVPAQQAPSPSLSAKSVTPTERLATVVRELGSVRVIVELAADVPQGALAMGPTGLAQAASVIEAAQTDVLATHLAGDGAKAERWAVRRIRHFPLMAMTVSAAELESLAADPRVVRVWEDAYSRPTLAESVPLIGMTGPSGAYASGADGTNTAVAVLDTGVQSSHPFMAGKVVDEACFSTTQSGLSTTVCPNGQPTQTGPGAGVNCAVNVAGCDHGTHVAGIAAGKQASGSPSNGVAKEARIIAVQVFSRVDSSFLCGGPSPCVLSLTSDQIAGLNHVLTKVGVLPQTIAAANMSLGGGQFPGTCDGDARKPAIDALRAANVATVVASGNNGYTADISAPACISTAVAVGSTTKADTVSSFSNMSEAVTVLAPGSSIVSSVPGVAFSAFSGTSMAAPHVAGAFAALRSQVPTATVPQISNALRLTGVAVVDGRGGGLTKPRIRVAEALAQLLSPGPALAVSPSAGLSAEGPVGGPFAPSSQIYTLQNVGTGSLTWSAASSNAGLAAVSSAGGTLDAGASTSVTVSLAPGAASLPLGLHNATISFTNGSGGVGSTSRPVRLAVGACADAFAAASVLSGSGVIAGSTAAATGEAGEPQHGGGIGALNSVWCKFTPPVSGLATFSTAGSGFDTTLTVYTGSALNALSQVAYNDNFGSPQSELTIAVQAGTTYHVVIDGDGDARGTYQMRYYLPEAGPTASVLSAVLPYARSVQVGAPATVFGTIINTSPSPAKSCLVTLPAAEAIPGIYSYQTTDASNQLTGAPNVPVDIAAGAAQGFVIAFTPMVAFPAFDIPLVFGCTNSAAAPTTIGLNTFLLSASATPVPDMVAIGSTLTNDGIMVISTLNNTGVFSAAAINIGASGSVTATVDTNGVSLPVSLTLCQTNTGTGACLQPPATSTTTTVANNGIVTYAVFASSSTPIPLDPAGSRVFLRLASDGVVRGATSVAVTR